MMIHPIILLGGSGTRLWPLSQRHFPKQFCVFTGKYSLFQQTLLRLKKLPSIGKIYLMVGEPFYFICLEQLSALNLDNIEIVVEPMGRNTAPAIATMATHIARTQSESDLMLVLPSDHDIQNVDAFSETIQAASHKACDKLILFGVKPNFAATAYGYIESENTALPSRVSHFIEKPNSARAKELIQKENIFWNSGIFFSSVRMMLQEFNLLQPDIIHLAQSLQSSIRENGNTIYLDRTIFSNMPDIAMDIAIMEKTQHAFVFALQSDWSDMGDWKAVYDRAQKNADGNALVGNVKTIETKNSYIRSDHVALATVGLDNIVVVATQQGILIADKNKTQMVRQLAELLKEKELIG